MAAILRSFTKLDNLQAHLTGYAWHIQNPDEVLKGAKPKLEERGPYVYKAVYIKDTEGMIWSDDATDLTYRPRRFYTYVPELSGEGLDPYKDMVTVPNIPLWTGLSKVILQECLKRGRWRTSTIAGS